MGVVGNRAAYYHILGEAEIQVSHWWINKSNALFLNLPRIHYPRDIHRLILKLGNLHAFLSAKSRSNMVRPFIRV
jgi:hypothetical protein